MGYNYSLKQITDLIDQYVNNEYITWSELLKRHNIVGNMSTFMKSMYKIVQNPKYISKDLFLKLQEKSIRVTQTLHPEGVNRIYAKFKKLTDIRNNGKDVTRNSSLSIEELESKKIVILFQISTYDDYATDDHPSMKSDLEKELDSINRQIQIAKRYG